MAVDTPRKCAGKDCENDASALQCPNCQKLGKEHFFCSQDCFKRNWVHSKTGPWLQAKPSNSLVG
jgi:methionyl aminopeptidase